MIPVLYASDCTSYLTHLSDLTLCEVTEERNGVYELYATLPTGSPQFAVLANDCVLSAKPAENADPQLFRVYKIEKDMTGGLAAVSAEHISYLLASYPVDAVHLASATATVALNLILDRANALTPMPHGFTAVSDVSASRELHLSLLSAHACFGGTEGSVLDVFGGEFEFDNYVVRLHARRGANRGVTVEYRKNLRALKATVSTESCYTGIFPYWKGEKTTGETREEITVTLPEGTLLAANPGNLQARTLMMDFSQDFETEPGEPDLRAHAVRYLAENDIAAPEMTFEVDFVQLWQSTEYAGYRDLECVGLCDTVTVRHPELGVDVSAKVIKTVYDALKERYTAVTLGQSVSNMASVVQKMRDEIKKDIIPVAEIQNKINAAVNTASDTIVSGLAGGTAILNPPQNPQELLILLDGAKTIQDAVRLWRWNAGGLGYSETGYNGTYAAAMTSDGQIVADFITTGVLNAGVIKAGTITDATAKNWWNLDSGEFHSETISAQIDLAEDGIFQSVRNSFPDKNAVQSMINQYGDSVEIRFQSTDSALQELSNEISSSAVSLEEYIRFSGANLEMGKRGNPYTIKITNTGMEFFQNGTRIAYFTNSELYIMDGRILNSFRLGKWMMEPLANDDLVIAWVGSTT
jgi:phage minor structural protein